MKRLLFFLFAVLLFAGACNHRVDDEGELTTNLLYQVFVNDTEYECCIKWRYQEGALFDSVFIASSSRYYQDNSHIPAMIVAGEMGEEVTPIGKPFISGGWEFFFTFNGTSDSFLYHYVYDKENSKRGLRYNPDVNFWFRLPSTERQDITQHMRRYTYYLSDVLSMIDKGTE